MDLQPSFLSNTGSISRAIIDILEKFFINGKLKSCVQENFICLIKKKEDAVLVKDFRPISLTTLSYKVVAKGLAEWLKLVIDSIIRPFRVPLSRKTDFESSFNSQ